MVNQNKRLNLSLCGNGAQKCTKQTTMNPLKNAANKCSAGTEYTTTSHKQPELS